MQKLPQKKFVGPLDKSGLMLYDTSWRCGILPNAPEPERSGMFAADGSMKRTLAG